MRCGVASDATPWRQRCNTGMPGGRSRANQNRDLIDKRKSCNALPFGHEHGTHFPVISAESAGDEASTPAELQQFVSLGQSSAYRCVRMARHVRSRGGQDQSDLRGLHTRFGVDREHALQRVEEEMPELARLG